MQRATNPPALVSFRPVRDLVASRAFYENALGLELVRDQGACLIFRVAVGGYLGICQSGYDGSEAPLATDERWIETIVVDDVEAMHRRLSDHAVEVDGPPRHNPRFGITQFFARDPDGYRIEVQRFDEPLR